MNFTSPAHIFCYLTIVTVFFCGLFFGNQELVFIKPISSLALIWIYFENWKKVNALYPLIIVIVMIIDVFVLTDFDRFFKYIGMLLPLYYLLSSYLLISFISFKNIRYKEIFTPSILIGAVLIIYLTFSVLNLLMPNFEDSIGYLILIIISLFYYLGCCFIIYIRNLYAYAYYLLIAAISSILVNAMLPIQELYHNNSVFEAVVYSADIVTMFFYLKFLISAKPKEDIDHLDFL